MAQRNILLDVVMLAGAIGLTALAVQELNKALTSKHLCALGRIRNSSFSLFWLSIAGGLVWGALDPFWPASLVFSLALATIYIVVAVRRRRHWLARLGTIARAKRMKRAGNSATPAP